MPSIFQGDMPGGQAMKECKPNYEERIERARRKAETAIVLQDSLYDYLDARNSYYGNDTRQLSLPALLGSLSLEIRATDKEIENLIALQEKDK